MKWRGVQFKVRDEINFPNFYLFAKLDAVGPYKMTCGSL